MDTVSSLMSKLKSEAIISANCIYLIIISDVNFSSLFNKVNHDSSISTSFSCQMQGSHLIERNKLVKNQLDFR